LRTKSPAAKFAVPPWFPVTQFSPPPPAAATAGDEFHLLYVTLQPVRLGAVVDKNDKRPTFL